MEKVFKVYNVPVQQIFETNFSIRARSAEEAHALAIQQFNMLYDVQKDSCNDVLLVDIDIGQAEESGVDEMNEFVYDPAEGDVVPKSEFA